MEMGLQLPDHRELSPRLLGFLDDHLNSLSVSLSYGSASDLAAELSSDCAEVDAHLRRLHENLANLLISWISRSIVSKTALLNLNLTTPSPPSQHGICSIKIQKMLGEDLPRLAMEVKRIENISNYAKTTIQLEAMVGDLEDAALSVVNQQIEHPFTKNCSHPSVSIGHGSRHEKFLLAVRAMNDIEELLVTQVKFKPQWCHLMKSVDTRVDKTLALLRPRVLADHRALLLALGWPPKGLSTKIDGEKLSVLPNPLVLMQIDKQKAYSESFLALCALQHLQMRREERQLGLLGQKKKLNIGLWAIDELVSPIASRIEYHFLKWVDQPEFIFALVYKITRDFIIGVDDVLQPLIDRAKLANTSAKEAWVSAMVQTLSAFLAKRVFSILSERYKQKKMRLEVISTWLHLIDLMVNFDKQMLTLLSSESFLFMEDSERLEESSRGLSVFSVFSNRPEWLKIWAKIELKDSKMKLREDLKHERAWLVDTKQEVVSAVHRTTEQFLLRTREDHKAPLIVESALKLAWEMIERCKTLPGILARIQFIRSTATKLLWYLFNLLHLQYKRAEFLANDFDNDSLLTLCGVINAARYCEYKLQEWSEDINFLEMRTAESNKNNVIDDVNDNFYFFAEEIKTLADLEMNWLMEIVASLLRQFETLTLDYVREKERFERGEEADVLVQASEGVNNYVSVDFLGALDTLRSQLCIINVSLNPKDFSDLWRSVADGIDHFIFRSMLTGNYRFSRKGTHQFRVDMQALFLVFQPFCARPEAFFSCIGNSLKVDLPGRL